MSLVKRPSGKKVFGKKPLAKKKWPLAKKVIGKKQCKKPIGPWTSAKFYPH